MANTSRPRGLRPVAYLNGAKYNGAATQYLCPSSDNVAMFVGDLVKSGGSAGAAGVVVAGQDVEGMPTIATAAAGDSLLRGVVVGFLPDPTNLQVLYRVASTNRIALVVDDPNVIFEIEEDALGAALAAVDVGENADIIATAGSTTTGQSAHVLDSSDHKTGTAQLRILGFVKRSDNNIGANAKMNVLINEHDFKSTTGT